MEMVDEMQVELVVGNANGMKGKIFNMLNINGLAVNNSGIGRSRFIRQTSIYSSTVEDEYVSVCFITNGLTPEWVSEIFDQLDRCGMKKMSMNYADNNGACAGYIDFLQSGITLGEHYSGGDISGLSERLLQVLDSWDSICHVFSDEEK